MSNPNPLAAALAAALLLAFAPPVVAGSASGPEQATNLKPVNVRAASVDGYAAAGTDTATRTRSLLRDIPQSITVVTGDLIRDLAMTSMADAVRYMPGVGMGQGEGHRDAPILRGNGSTADLFIDGMRDDVQYFRDLYNIERVEALKGPNAMIFGRGGSGGVLNRVSKVADGQQHRELSLQLGEQQRRRLVADFGEPIGESAAFRVTGLYEDSGSYRDGVTLKRYGINPTLALRAGERTQVTLGYEHFRDERVTDRGVPSYRGLPLSTAASTFFGDPRQSPTWVTVDAFNALVDHDFGNGLGLRNRTRYADYDKFYQNVFPGAVNAAGTQVSISAYSNATRRRNLFNQTDLTYELLTGAVHHTLLGGLELGRQSTDNFRRTGYFGGTGSPATSVRVPVSDPRYTLPVDFRQSATDPSNHGIAKVAALYLQDQIEFSPQWQAVLGLRYDRFTMEFHDNRSGQDFSSTDNLVSPRAGLVYKPVEPLSLYASYSIAHQPRAGEQLTSLTLGNRTLEPERFTNRELGAKWDVSPGLALTAAVYRLDRSNVAVTNPAWDPATNPGVPQSLLVDGQRIKGVELGFSGRLTSAWSVMGGYAWQEGEITRPLSPSLPAGTRLAQLPKHSASLWNRYDFNPMWGAGVGAIHQGPVFASTSNRVTLKGYTRYDAAVFLTLSPQLRLQLNVENLFDKRYFVSAHNDNNITPGSPRAFYLGVNVRL
ncbi:TonB-dependent receptor [Rhodanobacter thiooxydans]|uniref:TonB-dependent receptor n=1 Tax=Rhodanobacter thiooxydans TaxID=416169 RepID=A0A154QGL7_9GAMM|nr:TonB-dependent siderophore receptor [Rhodanobacter thiooxydans]EIL98796.1 TonB-dependent siderophore receptor [Rhodanobacter thiooxydans LCS2]KZC23381.1 TonB-dependent receptor [Rhodanobacter thiooxydans]MCW0200270.1 TonB-dependent siderophore receptor [Rhodanobacter thiooxydans]